MYPLHTPEVVILDRVRQDPLANARLERMLAAIETDRLTEVDEAGFNDLVAQRGWNRGGWRTGQYRMTEPPPLLFSTFRWASAEEFAELRARYPNLTGTLWLGQAPWTFRDASTLRRDQSCVCQSAWEIHCAYGCLHACDYCHVPNWFLINLNLEELAKRVRAFGETVPEQNLYKFDNMTDTIALEPEYGASAVMVPLFADWPGRYLLLYTKSDNVDHLLELPHNGKTMVSWSLSSARVAEQIEKGTPSMEARIAAIEKCQRAGYTVRVRISPICPIRDWREDYRELVQQLLTRTRPDVISLDVLGWMDPATMKEALDVSLFENQYAAVLDKLIAEGFRRLGKHVFPHDMRAEILRFVIAQIHEICPEQPVSLCMETVDMWRELSPELGRMAPGNYACCCGPTSVPGHPLVGPR